MLAADVRACMCKRCPCTRSMWHDLDSLTSSRPAPEAVSVQRSERHARGVAVVPAVSGGPTDPERCRMSGSQGCKDYGVRESERQSQPSANDLKQTKGKGPTPWSTHVSCVWAHGRDRGALCEHTSASRGKLVCPCARWPRRSRRACTQHPTAHRSPHRFSETELSV